VSRFEPETGENLQFSSRDLRREVLDGTVDDDDGGAQRPQLLDQLRDRHADLVLGAASDGKGGENDRQVRFGGVAGAIEHRSR